MAKDPAFLFYYHDFLVGTDHMTDEQVGQYIKCLCHQANRGSIREPHMVAICKTIDNFNVVSEKFTKNGKDEFFNERLRFEIEKRQKYTKSRLDNLHMVSHMDKSMEPHMENENEIINENINVIENKIIKEHNFNLIWDKYPSKVGKEDARRHFKTSVKTDKDFEDIQKAIGNYINSKRVQAGFIQNGSKWFKNWRDWVNPPEKGKEDDLPESLKYLRTT